MQIEEAGNDVRAWLEHVNEFLKDGQWKDAVETLRRVMENRGDRLIETSDRPAVADARVRRVRSGERILPDAVGGLAQRGLRKRWRSTASKSTRWPLRLYDEAIDAGQRSEAAARGRRTAAQFRGRSGAVATG